MPKWRNGFHSTPRADLVRIALFDAAGLCKSSAMAGNQLTELEGCVLAVIRNIGQATGYQVRKAFRESLTATWRASTGSIYPLLRKLVAKGLLDEAVVAGDARRTRRLSVSPAGEAALRLWLCQTPAVISSPVPDPVRTRSYAVMMLGIEPGRALVAEWRDATRDYLNRVRKAQQSDSEDGYLERMAHRGTELQLEARLKWLDELVADFGEMAD